MENIFEFENSIFEGIRLKISDFLATPLASDSIILNNWQVVHFIAGFLLVFLFFRYKLFQRFGSFAIYVLIGLLILWEIFEWSIGFPSFMPETNADILFDVGLGLVAILIALKYKLFN